jgi:hypothetical protein
VCDINDLELYDEAMRVLFGRDDSSSGETLCKIRLLAVKSKPRDEKLAIACFRACLRRSNWEHAQQVRYSYHIRRHFLPRHVCVGLADIII